MLLILFTFADDPYYCGLRARIPNFVKSRKKKLEEKAKKEAQAKDSQRLLLQNQTQHPSQPGQRQILPAPTLSSMGGIYSGVTSTNPLWWHSRLNSDPAHLASMILIVVLLS